MEKSVNCNRLKATHCKKVKQRHDTQTIIHFGLMLSFPDPQERPYLASSFDDGHDIAPAVYLAVKQVNNRSDLLIDYHIEILRLDGGCSVTERTVIGVNELVCSCENVVGIIGPSCKLSSRTVSQLTNHEEFSMITVNYGDQNFAGIGNYPYSFGILGASSMYGTTFAELIKHNKWKNYALLYSGSNKIYSGIGRNLLNLTFYSGFQPRYSSAIYDTFIPLKQVMESYSRVIIVIASPPTIARVLCLAYHKGMVFPSYQWVFQETLKQDFSRISFTYQGRLYSCSESEFNRSANGSINLFSNALHDRNNVSDMLKTYSHGYELQANEYSKEFGVKSATKQWAKGFYDAVWALAYALNDSLVDLNTNLNELKVGSPILAEAIKYHMSNVHFHGVTGDINFDNITGFNKEGFLSLFQYTECLESVNIIGFYKDGQLKISPNSSHIFIDSSFPEEFIEIDDQVAAIILVFTLITMFLVISAQIINICYRNDPRIKASSPKLNHLIFIGSYMIVIGIILHCLETVLYPLIRLYFCNFVPFLFSVGITLYLGTSCIKTWRLNRIYVHSKRLNKDDIKSIKGYILVGFVTTLVVIDLLVCIIWRVVDPLTLKPTRQLNTIGSDGERVMLIENACHSNYEVYWYVALLTPKVLLIIASFFLAFSTQMNIKEFKTDNIIILTYFLTVIFGLGIPLHAISIIAHIGVSVSTTVLSLFLNLTTCVCIFILFLPLIKA